MNGSELKLNFADNSTVEHIKQRIEKETSILVSQQRLIYIGKLMNDQNTLKSYNIINNDVILLITMLRGG